MMRPEFFHGRAHCFGDDVDTDGIIPARYLVSSDPKVLAAHCMEDIDHQYAKKVSNANMIVGGENFGCGSSREHAPIAIKAAGISCVIAKSFARIFYRNCFNIGLPIFVSEEASQAIKNGDELEIDTRAGTIRNATHNEEYPVVPYPAFMIELLEAGGLIPYLLKQHA